MAQHLPGEEEDPEPVIAELALAEAPSPEVYETQYEFRPLDAIQLDLAARRFTLQTRDRLGRAGEFAVVVTATAAMVTLSAVLCRAYPADGPVTVVCVALAAVGTPAIGWFWHRRGGKRG